MDKASTEIARQRTHLDGLSQDNYAFIERYIHRETGIALGADKRYLLESRLAPVLAEEHLRSLNALCDRLRLGAPEPLRRRIAECMTTHETLFFRDPGVFEALRSEILPQLAKARQTTKILRIWSAACSSGQEAYSVAMLLLEAGYGSWQLDILGTDISSRILSRAREGRYLQIEVSRGLPAELLGRYFRRVGADWQVSDDLKRFVRFAPFDLRQNMSALGPFDIVLCRNVMIYFDLPTRKKIFAQLHATMAPGAYLLLGSSETTFNLDQAFIRRPCGNSVVYQNAR
jgi:chemotaxis protein methyltransferase CheR